MSKIIKSAAVGADTLELKFREKFVSKQETETQVVKNVPTPEEQAQALIDEAKNHANATIAKAKQEADQIIKIAQDEAKKLKIKAEQQGQQEALKKAKKEADQIRLQAQQVLQQAEQVREETFTAMEQEIINLALEIAERFLATQLELNPDIVVEVAKEALHLVKDREQITIYVNPEDIGAYIGRKPELVQMLSDRARLSIIADANVKPSGCLVQTEQGIVEATADVRWQEIMKAIFPA